MMTACDLSAITKPWEVQSKVRDVKWRMTTVLLLSSVQSAISSILGRPLCGSWILGAGWSWEDSSWATTYREYLNLILVGLLEKRPSWKQCKSKKLMWYLSFNLAHDGQEQSRRPAKASVWFYRLCLYFCLQGTVMNEGDWSFLFQEISVKNKMRMFWSLRLFSKPSLFVFHRSSLVFTPRSSQCMMAFWTTGSIGKRGRKNMRQN